MHSGPAGLCDSDGDVLEVVTQPELKHLTSEAFQGVAALAQFLHISCR